MRKNRIRTAAAVLASAMLLAGNVSAGDLSIFDGIGAENDQISALQGFAYSEDVVALDDLGISVSATGYTAIRQDAGFVYIYTDKDGSMPYVIIGRYDGESDQFADAFTAYMKSTYGDSALLVTEPAASYSLGGLEFDRIVYQYPVGEYTVKDTRLFYGWNGHTYMFGTKEVPLIGFEVPSGLLEQVAGSFAPLAGGDGDYAKHVDSTRSVEGEVFSVDVNGPSDDGPVGGPVDGIPGGGPGSPAPTDSVDGRIVFDETKAPYQGTWVEFEDGFKMFLPSEWSYYNLTEEQTNSGIIYIAGDSSGSAGAPYMEVSWIGAGGLETPRQIGEELAGIGLRVDGMILVNDIMCVSYVSEQHDISGLMFFHPYDSDYIMNVAVTPFSQNVNLLGYVLCSLSLA